MGNGFYASPRRNIKNLGIEGEGLKEKLKKAQSLACKNIFGKLNFANSGNSSNLKNEKLILGIGIVRLLY
jgi:hypothetical protein